MWQSKWTNSGVWRLHEWEWHSDLEVVWSLEEENELKLTEDRILILLDNECLEVLLVVDGDWCNRFWVTIFPFKWNIGAWSQLFFLTNGHY